jgi:hypothetical protein
MRLAVDNVCHVLQSRRGILMSGFGRVDLRIVQITEPTTGDVTPVPDDRSLPTLARGRGGSAICEVVNLWKGSWSTGKGVTDLDWGVGRESCER